MSEFRADLHCHSTCSDGTFTPRELLLHAKELGLSGISITDHDTVSAYPAAFEIGNQMGVKVIAGVEFSTIVDTASVHLLGYSFALNNEGIQSLCKRHLERRKDRNLKILSKLKSLQMPLCEKDLYPFSSLEGSVGRVHIAQAMIAKGYVRSLQEAFNKFIGEGQPCFDAGTGVAAEETIHCIKQAGGKAIIAHPHLISDPLILEKLLGMNFDGIEVYYGRFFAAQVQLWAGIAKKKDWIMTGGSDFHGKNKVQSQLGCSWVSSDVFDSLHSLSALNNPYE